MLRIRHLIHQVSRAISERLFNEAYGEGVKEIIVRVICVSPEFEWFSKIKPPKYRFHHEYVNRDGIEIIEDRLFTYSTRIDHETFKSQSDDENKAMLISEILKSLSLLYALPKN